MKPTSLLWAKIAPASLKGLTPSAVRMLVRVAATTSDGSPIALDTPAIADAERTSLRTAEAAVSALKRAGLIERTVRRRRDRDGEWHRPKVLTRAVLPEKGWAAVPQALCDRRVHHSVLRILSVLGRRGRYGFPAVSERRIRSLTGLSAPVLLKGLRQCVELGLITPSAEDRWRAAPYEVRALATKVQSLPAERGPTQAMTGRRVRRRIPARRRAAPPARRRSAFPTVRTMLETAARQVMLLLVPERRNLARLLPLGEPAGAG